MSPLPAKNVLLTGRPGCGKTTVVRGVIRQLEDLSLAGFYTQEIRQHGRRVGFEAIGLGGASATLAHIDFRTKNRVGRYGVELDGFESLVRTELGKPIDELDLFIIDEIGKMECYSRTFIEAAARALGGPIPVLAIIAAKGGGFISQVKARADVRMVTVSAANRDKLPLELAQQLLPR